MSGKPTPPASAGEFLLYQAEDGQTRIECRFEGETLWLSQSALAELYGTTKQNISLHLKNIFRDKELEEGSVVKEYLTTRADGKAYRVQHYNLNAIIAIGYRVRSDRGTQFRQWATRRLEEYLQKGFTMDDARLKQAGGDTYFEELLARIRDIRSSERVFWRKVLDIYATSIDYDPRAEASALFFRTVQNKMHWAAHGHTAAEVVHQRANASLPQMGLTTWAGAQPRKSDVSIAKNYLQPDEIEALNRIVTAYLEFAEVQAMSRKPMTMTGWITKLDDFLRLSDRDLLTHAGRISHDQAKLKAEGIWQEWQRQQDALPHPVDEHFRQAIEQLDAVTKTAKKRKSRE